MKRLLYFLIIFFILIPAVESATYNYYFSNSGKNGSVISDCTNSGDPCKWINTSQVGYTSGITAQNCIDGNSSTDTVNLRFNGEDTWTVNSTASGVQTYYGLYVESTDPYVNILSYGSGKAIFDGNVSSGDFSSVPVHSAGGPCRWNRFFEYHKTGIITNIEIQNVYGNAIFFETDSNIDGFIVSNCEIHHVGRDAIDAGTGSFSNCKVKNNLIHHAMMLYKESKSGGDNLWGTAVAFYADPGTYNVYDSNLVQYNVIYNVWGECISNPGGITEYNRVGDCGSYSIYSVPAGFDGRDTIVRYNLVTQSSDNNKRPNSGEYDVGDGGIVYADEDRSIGDNSNADIEIHGNWVINTAFGIRAYHGAGTSGNAATYTKSVKIYNNTVIDCSTFNYAIAHHTEFISGEIRNNASILYDRTGNLQTQDVDGVSPNWTIDNNSFWDKTAGNQGTVDIDWRTNYVTGDPKLTGELTVSWTSLSADSSGVDVDDMIPENNESSLVEAGDVIFGYNYLLDDGATFANLPSDTSSFVLRDLNSYGWPIGAGIYDSTSLPQPPTNICITFW